MPQTIKAKDGTELDAGVVNLAKAIRARESRGDYNAVGDAGTSKGAYQWQPGNFESAAKQYGLDPKDFSPVNQDKVAYHQVKALKDKGYTPEQVAAAWNAGEGSLKGDAWKTKVGDTTINGQKIHYDVPAYVNSVIGEFRKVKGATGGTTGYNPAPFSGGVINFSGVTPPEPTGAQTDGSFVGDVSKTLGDAGTGIADAVSNTMSGKINPLSGLIQGAGAGAGALGGLVNNVLEHTPVVGGVYKGIEGAIGGAVQGAVNTDVGKSLMSKYNNLPDEVRGDIGGLVNILSAIPLFKGLGLAKTALKDSVTTAFKGSVEKGAASELRGALTKTPAASLARAEGRGLNPVGTLVKEKKYLPEVENVNGKFVYNSEGAIKHLDESLGADEATLQKSLDQAVTKNIGVDLRQVREQTLKDVAEQYTLSGEHDAAINAVNKYFDSIANSAKGRSVISLNELNQIKRNVRGAVFAVDGDIRGTATANLKYEIGQSLMKQVEKTATEAGVEGVPALNQVMGTKLEALKILKAINGKGIKNAGGLIREAGVDVAGGVGEAVGNTLGIPLAGTFAGRGLARIAARRAPRTAVGKIKRLNPPGSTLRKGLLKVSTGLAGQGTTQLQNK